MMGNFVAKSPSIVRVDDEITVNLSSDSRSQYPLRSKRRRPTFSESDMLGDNLSVADEVVHGKRRRCVSDCNDSQTILLPWFPGTENHATDGDQPSRPKGQETARRPAKSRVLTESDSANKRGLEVKLETRQVEDKKAKDGRKRVPRRVGGRMFTKGNAAQKYQRQFANVAHEVRNLHMDEGVFHLLHSLPAKRQAGPPQRFEATKGVKSTTTNGLDVMSATAPAINSTAAKKFMAKIRQKSAHSALNSPDKTETDSEAGRQNRLIALSPIKIEPDLLASPDWADDKMRTVESWVADASSRSRPSVRTTQIRDVRPNSTTVIRAMSGRQYKVTSSSTSPSGTSSSHSSPTSKTVLIIEHEAQPEHRPMVVKADPGPDLDVQVAAMRRLNAEVSTKKALTAGIAVSGHYSSDGSVMASLSGKEYKDIVLRSYRGILQVILAPTTTGIKSTFNVNVISELADVLTAVANADKTTKKSNYDAILLSSLDRSVFSHGIDLTSLSQVGSADRQRRAASSLAKAIEKLALILVSYPKTTIASVSGRCAGLGCALLPLFDLVYASETAMFEMATCGRSGAPLSLGQELPEAFASETLLAMPMGRHLDQFLTLFQSLTAAQAKLGGLVTDVVTCSSSDLLTESVVGRVQSSTLSTLACQIRRKGLRRRILAVMETQTAHLATVWAGADFSAQLRAMLSDSSQTLATMTTPFQFQGGFKRQ